MKLLTLVDELNEVQKKVLVSKLLSYYEGNLEGKKFAVWGLAFKPNTDDMREAPSITIINSILKLGGRVAAYDPVAMEKAKECFGNKINYAENEYEACENADAILILTEWNEFRNPNFERMNRVMKDSVIFDGRNLFDPNEVEEKGFSYLSIGRKAVIRNKHYRKLKAS
jgi:UDPglucose 6-dehydrogenase